jgi:hypothetical protein
MLLGAVEESILRGIDRTSGPIAQLTWMQTVRILSRLGGLRAVQAIMCE